MAFNIIKVSRTSSPRKHHIPDVTVALNKHGDLSLVLSENFFSAQDKLAVGSRILIGYNPETHELALVPATETNTESVRTIRRRPTLEGAGTIVITGKDVPDGMPVPSAKRSPVEWTLGGEDGAVYLSMSF